MADVLRRNTLQYARMCPSTMPHYTDKPRKKMASIIKLPSGAYRVQIRQNRSLKYEINSSRQNRGGSIRQRPGVHCSEGACLDRSCPRKDRIHRTRLIMGKRILRKLQCRVPRRVAQWRSLLQPTGGQSPDRTMEDPLQNRQAAQQIGISPAAPESIVPIDHRPTIN